MTLKNYLANEAIRLQLNATTVEEALSELVGTLGLSEEARNTVERLLRRREEIGSTGVGHGVAIPHTRCLTVEKLRLAYGHSPAGIEWHAIDGHPVHHIFLIAAPTSEGGDKYLPVLSKVAQFAKEPETLHRLAHLAEPQEVLALIEEKGV
ncbi:MAG TPA: PTS sugar transporter subunit IIA [Gemmatimonadales bacterium]|nr:PTS sugar transporter subunit IIA [Gemmatimonadales bacterium]